jgi:hypothetical protein
MNEKVVYMYTREDALADGFLVDVTLMARAAEYDERVAISADCYMRCVFCEPSAIDLEVNRLWNVLIALRRHVASSGRLYPVVRFVVGVRRGIEAVEPVELKAVFEYGGDGERQIIIMLPGED